MSEGTFWRIDEQPAHNVALIEDGGVTLTYGELAERVAMLRDLLPSRALMFCYCENSAASLSGYLAALNAGAVPLMLDGALDPELSQQLLHKWQPALIWHPDTRQSEGEVLLHQDGYKLVATGYASPKMDASLALLITTSGSTGSPKLVRQTYRNLQSNCTSICDYLEINASERPLVYLPMNYVFGLSIIHSHLARGATLLMTRNSPLQGSFWAFVKAQEATSLSGVPYTFEMLTKLRFMRMNLPSLRTLTQAGGKLSVTLQEAYGQWAQEQGKRFFVMYGASEATSRMGYLPPAIALDNPGKIGIAIPGGAFALEDAAGDVIDEPNVVGELIYYGENVSPGYADEPLDLVSCDHNGGRLATGDMAKRDAQGLYTIVGRKKRFLKVFGNRVGLDELEQLVKNHFPQLECAAGGEDDHIRIWLTESASAAAVKEYVATVAKLHHSALTVIVTPEIPKNSAGKTLYAQLDSLHG